MKTIKIFLASSEELSEERLIFADLVENLNHSLSRLDIRIQLVKWEYLDSSMGPLHKQEEYNQELRDCEMCLVLYWTKFGMYTEMELETAFNEMKAGHNPKKVYVYFKEDESVVTDELKVFRDSLQTKYGHFYTPFSNFDTLKAHFLLQFMAYQSRILPEGKGLEVRNGNMTIDGTDYVDLKNVPFAGNNEEYQLLQKNIKKTQKLLALTEKDDPDYSEYAKDLNELKEKLAKMESSLWDTALMITRLSTTKCSERLERAMQLFNKGDNKGALAVLNEVEIEKDASHYIDLIRLGDEGREGLKTNVAELEMRISSLRNENPSGCLDEIVALRIKILDWVKILNGNESPETGEAYMSLGGAYSNKGDYGRALECTQRCLSIYLKVYGNDHVKSSHAYCEIGVIYHNKGQYDKALEYDWKALQICKSIHGDDHPDTAFMYDNIGSVYNSIEQYDKAMEYYQKALQIRKSVLGDNHKDTAISYQNIGFVYYNIKQYDKALEYHHKALQIRESILGEDHIETARSYGYIWDVYSSLGQEHEGFEYFLKWFDLLGD